MRLFIALAVPAAARQRLADLQERVRELHLPMRTTRSEALHLTVVFLGETPEERVGDIRPAMEASAATVPPARLTLGALGVFPNQRNPRVLWAGVSGDVSAVTTLHSHLVEKLRARGFAIEARAFRPHVTLARARDEWSAAHLAALRELLANPVTKPESWLAEELHLVRSELDSHGARYTTLYTSALKG